MSTRTEDYIRLAQSFGKTYDTHSTSNKAQLIEAVNFIRKVPKNARAKAIKEMKKVAEKEIPINTARAEYNKLLGMVETYELLPKQHINVGLITYDNISRALRLVKRVEKHYEGKYELLLPLKEAYEEGISPDRYNNNYTEACKRLAEKLPAKVKTAPLTTEAALLDIDRAPIEVKTAMLERLLSDLGYSMEDVA